MTLGVTNFLIPEIDKILVLPEGSESKSHHIKVISLYNQSIMFDMKHEMLPHLARKLRKSYVNI